VRILFAGTPEFAIAPLKVLLEQHDIVAVFTQPDRRAGRGKKLTPPPVKRLAEQHGIPVFQPDSLRQQAELIADLKVDVMVVVAYGVLLPQEVLDIPPLGCINIHASILPRWRGAAPIQRAIQSGDSKTGVSIMKMELGLDTGPVYQVLETPIDIQDTSATLHDKLAILGAQGIRETLAKLEREPTFEPTVQNNEQASYASKISKQEAQIDWNNPAEKIQQQIRAFNPWPMCQTRHKQTRIRLWQSSLKSESIRETPGKILEVNQDGIVVGCGVGLLQIERLQKDGGKPLVCEQFINGYAIQAGDFFN